MNNKLILLIIILVFNLPLNAQKVEHPSLLYSAERVQAAKQKINKDTIMADAWQQIEYTANEQLQKKGLNKSDYLSLAYLLIGDKKYSNKLKEILLEVIKAETWGSDEMLARIPVWRGDLGMAHKALLSAIAYDAIYNELTNTERKQIAEGLRRLALEP